MADQYCTVSKSHFHGYRRPTLDRSHIISKSLRTLKKGFVYEGNLSIETMSVRNRILGPPVPKMPLGLVELMDGLARDVLKNNPENIYEFCAQHMQKLLEIRDGRAPRPILTLDEKIQNAQKKVRQRAEERRQAYDKIITENNNKQEVKQSDNAPTCGDDSESSKNETGIKDIQTKDNIIKAVEVKESEQAHVLTSGLKNEVNDTNVTLNEDEELKVNKSDKNNSIPENLTVTSSDENEESNMSKENDPETEHTVKDTDVDNNSPKQVQTEATSDINMADNVVKSEPDEVAIKIENSYVTKQEISVAEDIKTQLDNETCALILNTNDIEVKDEVEGDTKITSGEIISSNTAEKAVASKDNREEIAHVSIEDEQIDKKLDTSVANNSLDVNEKTEIGLNTELKDDLPKTEVENSNDTEKLEMSTDDQILSVILDSDKVENVRLQSAEPESIQPNELDPIEIVVSESMSNEVESKSEPSTDIESVTESAPENDKSNNSSMDLETAAITIQKVFRSFLFKTKTASYDDATSVDITSLADDKEKEENEVPIVKDRRHLGISRMDTVLQTVNEEKSLSLSTDDSSTLSSAATIIQAHVRGFLVRNKFNLNKTISSNSLIDSDAPSIPSLDADSDNVKSKTVLNIHIVPEGNHFVSRDESILTSMDLSLDSSPPSSVNLHPLGYDKTERRKQLKREDAIQSVSPPSNNSGKLSEDHDSVKEVLIVEGNAEVEQVSQVSCVKTSVEADANDVLKKEDAKAVTENDSNVDNANTDSANDEMDVVTPFAEGRSSRESDNSTKLLHSGEFHDIVVPTNVTRTDTSVVRGE